VERHNLRLSFSKKDALFVNVKIKMPDFGTTSAEVTVLRWYIQPGQRIERGQALMEIETDKSTMDVESIVCGIVKELLVGDNDSVDVGQEIAIIETEMQVDSPTDAPVPTVRSPADEQSKPSAPPAAQGSPRRGGLFSRNRAQKPADGNDSQSKPA
jgi:pyruvate/2-oxoglutarate dehydrogenase complex dihydrolipoamide acyltransferase (E2) component